MIPFIVRGVVEQFRCSECDWAITMAVVVITVAMIVSIAVPLVIVTVLVLIGFLGAYALRMTVAIAIPVAIVVLGGRSKRAWDKSAVVVDDAGRGSQRNHFARQDQRSR